MCIYQLRGQRLLDSDPPKSCLALMEYGIFGSTSWASVLVILGVVESRLYMAVHLIVKEQASPMIMEMVVGCKATAAVINTKCRTGGIG